LIFCVWDSLGKVSQAFVQESFGKFLELLFGTFFCKVSRAFYVQDSFGKVSLKFLFRTHFANFFELLVQDSFGKVSQVFCVQNSFGKVSQAFCSELIWQSSSSFSFTTDLSNASMIPIA
jgi:hypothetical protein